MKEIYFDELAQFFSERTGCSLNDALAYCEAEDQYYDEQAINSYDPDERPRDNGPYIGAPVIDNDDMVKYIADATGLDEDLVEKLSLLEIDYLDMQED